jgi:hypothetical protein
MRASISPQDWETTQAAMPISRCFTPHRLSFSSGRENPQKRITACMPNSTISQTRRRESLPQIYNLKAVADYETGSDAIIPVERASSAVESATIFVETLARLIP